MEGAGVRQELSPHAQAVVDDLGVQLNTAVGQRDAAAALAAEGALAVADQRERAEVAESKLAEAMESWRLAESHMDRLESALAAALADRDRLAEVLQEIDTIPWDSQTSAQMRTIAHFALAAAPQPREEGE